MKNGNSILIDVLKDRYDYEQFRKNNFDNVIGIPVTILALLIGGLATFGAQEKQLDVIIRIGALVGIAPIALSIFHLIRVFFGLNRKYDVLPTGDIIKDHYDKLTEYHDSTDAEDPLDLRHKKVILSFQEDLAKWYVVSNKRNCEINDLRAEHLHKSKMWLIISIVVIFILFIVQIIIGL